MNHITTEEKLRHIIEAANIHTGDSILDVGCGTGLLLPGLAEATGTFGMIDAIDINPDMLAQAHAHYAKLPVPVRFMLADIENDPNQNLYDRVILFDILPHLNRPLETIIHLYFHNLGGAGCLTIAQPAGREMTDTLSLKNSTAGHRLPPASEMADRLTEHGLRIDYLEDNEDYYILRLRRH